MREQERRGKENDRRGYVQDCFPHSLNIPGKIDTENFRKGQGTPTRHPLVMAPFVYST